MAGLDPQAPVYVPVSHDITPFGSYHYSSSRTCYFVFNQSMQVTPYFELCPYPPPPPPPPPPPHGLVYSTYCACWKGFAWSEIHSIPLELPVADDRIPSTHLSKEEEEESLGPDTKVNEEVQCEAAAEARKGSFKRFGCGGSFVWRRKGSVPRVRSRRKESELKGDENVAVEVDGGKTTVMIKNLPNKFTKEKLLGILDQHCYEENQKIMEEGNEKPLELGKGDISSTTLSEFDFLYLPIDFNTGNNMGYAFVNFTSAVAAWRLYSSLQNYDWKPHGSRKICVVTYARIQGLPALQKHFKNSTFVCHSDDFLPVRFIPARSGYCRTEQQHIGKRLLFPNPDGEDRGGKGVEQEDVPLKPPRHC